MSAQRGFILQSGFRMEGQRAVVYLHGKLDDGRTFLVRDRRVTPHFFVRERDAGAASLRETAAAPTALCTLQHEPVMRVTAPSPMAQRALAERLSLAGVPTYEADLRFTTRYLIDHGLRGSLSIEGTPRQAPGVDVCFDEPELAPGDASPPLRTLSFDIETEPAADRLLAISLYGCGASEVLLWTPDGLSCPAGAVPFATEAELLTGFCRRVRELDPDVLTGWNVIDFDLTELLRYARRAGVAFELGRGPGGLRIDATRYRWGSSTVTLPGRVVLDGIALLRGAFVRLEEYSLDFVAREVLGEGKVFAGEHRVEEIVRTFREERERFVAYNLADSRLALEIVEKLRLVELAAVRSRLTGLSMDRVASSIAAFDFLYLMALRRRGLVAPSQSAEPESSEPQSGGHVLEPEPGLHRNVLVFDFKSLYPSLIRTFQIDPAGLLTSPAPADDAIIAPSGAAFRRAPGLLPAILDELFPRREEAKAAGDAVASQAIKILMNSFYGVLGAPACRFHHPELANAITSFGREILLWSKARFESEGLRVLYGDTDSLFVLASQTDGLPSPDGGLADPGGELPDARSAQAAREQGQRLLRTLNDDLGRHIKATWRVESKLELELDTLYLRLFLPHGRHSAAGARKRYAGLADERDGPALVFTGMEVVRRDWTELARSAQRELYARLFRDEPVDAYLRALVADVRAGRSDSLLVYRKALRKDLDEYTASTPPHVVAARKLKGPPGRLIFYVMTMSGPEPAAERKHAFDHEHYVQKQLRPVAEPVLELFGLDFDHVVGDDVQLLLF